jgi:hypothetical protein
MKSSKPVDFSVYHSIFLNYNRQVFVEQKKSDQTGFHDNQVIFVDIWFSSIFESIWRTRPTPRNIKKRYELQPGKSELKLIHAFFSFWNQKWPTNVEFKIDFHHDVLSWCL